MKKLLCVLAVLLLVAGVAHAGQVYTTIISETTLNADPTSANGTANIADRSKVAFFVSYDETEVGNSVSAAVTCQISYDGTNWLSASFYDYAGGSTLQTSETISSDGYYYFWFNKDLAVPYVKVIITATNTDADDLAEVAAYMFSIN